MAASTRTLLKNIGLLSGAFYKKPTYSLLRSVTSTQGYVRSHPVSEVAPVYGTYFSFPVRHMSSSKKKKTAQDWQKELTPEQYYVAREGGTEPPFSGAYYNHYGVGVYQCVCCGTDLFSSKNKFESGCGWPSFHTAEGVKSKEDASTDVIDIHTDTSHMMVRTEVLCSNCNAHLGHVFPDGPAPTGLRYCINSLSLKFAAKKVK